MFIYTDYIRLLLYSTALLYVQRVTSLFDPGSLVLRKFFLKKEPEKDWDNYSSQVPSIFPVPLFRCSDKDSRLRGFESKLKRFPVREHCCPRCRKVLIT